MITNLGDRFLANSSTLDAADNVWRAPVLLAYPSIGPVGQTGEILVSATSEEFVSYAPLKEDESHRSRPLRNNRDAIEGPFHKQETRYSCVPTICYPAN